MPLVLESTSLRAQILNGPFKDWFPQNCFFVFKKRSEYTFNLLGVCLYTPGRR